MSTAIDNLRKRLGPLGWGALAMFAVFRFGDVLNLLYKVFLGRALPALDFGAIDPLMGVLAVLSLPVAVIFQVAMKSISRLHGMGREAECRALLRDLVRVAVIGMVVTVAGVYLLEQYVLTRLHLESPVYLHLTALLLAVGWWQPLYGAIQQGALRYRIVAISSFLNPALTLVLTFTFVAVASWGLPGALLARALGTVATTALLAVLLRGFFAGEKRAYRDEFRLMAAMVCPMGIYLISMTLLFQFDRLLVRNFLLQESGGYGALVTVGSIPTYFLGPIVFVLFPLAASEHAAGRDLKRFYSQALAIGLGVTAVCVLAFSLFGGWLLNAWNPAFGPFARYLWPYALAMGLHGTIDILASVELARHRYGFLWLLAAPVAIMCAALYVWRAQLGIAGIVWVLVAARAAILFCLWAYGERAESRP